MEITLDPVLERFVRDKVESGSFSSAVDVVEKGLRLLQAEEDAWKAEAQRKIEAGWQEAKSGKLIPSEKVEANMAALKTEWNARHGST